MATRAPPTTAQGEFDPEGQAEAEAAFLDATPGFGDTAILNELRASA